MQSIEETSLRDVEKYDPVIYEELSAEEMRSNPTWFVTLSDGRRAYHKHESHAWLELKEWLKQNPGVFIDSLYFQFRDHVILIGAGHDSYFFSFSLLAEYNGPTFYYYIGGFIEDGIVKQWKYKVPEMLLTDELYFSENDPDVQRGLIRRTCTS